MSTAPVLAASEPLPIWQAQPLLQVTIQQVTAKALNARLAQDIAQRLTSAIDARGFAVLRVKVRVNLVDERCVPNTHPDSNALLVQSYLLQALAAQAQFVPMVSTATEVPNITNVPLLSPVVQAKSAAVALLVAGIADVLVLGVCNDGHTASLFPDAHNLQDALDTRNTQACVAIELAHPPANAPYARVTQTLAHILSARHIVLPLSGRASSRPCNMHGPKPMRATPCLMCCTKRKPPSKFG